MSKELINIYNSIYKITNDLFISVNSILVYEKDRNGFLIEQNMAIKIQ